MEIFIGEKAPDFNAIAVMPDNTINDCFNLKKYIKNHKALIFFYPLNFTFVCPTEIIAFDKKYKEFEERKVKIIGISVDSQFSHLTYKNLPLEKGGIGSIQYPLISDVTKQISNDYNVLSKKNGVAFRGTFLIDENNIIRYQAVNDLELGRNIEEILRLIDALIYSTKSGNVCPANWFKGKPGITPTPNGIKKFLQSNKNLINNSCDFNLKINKNHYINSI